MATSKGKYAVVRQYANLFPYKREVMTLLEKDMGRQAIEKEIQIFNEICYGKQTLTLKSPINAEWMLSEDEYSLYYEPLDISVFAPTMDECVEDFQEELDILYKVYAKEIAEKLSEGAQKKNFKFGVGRAVKNQKMAIKARKIDSALRRKGFIKEEGRKHVYYIWMIYIGVRLSTTQHK